jgi:outer membrane protein OmpA-like peptidoglycan-associated protein
MADGETLIFSSDKLTPNKGKMDLYFSRFNNGEWSDPRPLDFANTERDDQYVSATALGRYLLKEARGARDKFELTEFLFPEDIRPKGALKVEGQVSMDGGSPISAYLSVKDVNSRKRVYSGRPTPDGSFSFYLAEGTQYELSIDPEQGYYTYYSQLFDLTQEKLPQKESITALLKKPSPGDALDLRIDLFKPSSALLTITGEDELKRVARMIKENPARLFEIRITLKGYREDTMKSEEFSEVKTDTLSVVAADSVSFTDGHAPSVFHNDKTLAMAKAVNEYLLSQGVSESQVRFSVNAEPSDEVPVIHTSILVE